MPWIAHTRSLLLAFVAVCGFVDVAASAPNLEDRATRVESVLAEIERPNAPAESVIAQRLSALGPEVLPALLESLSRESSVLQGEISKRAEVILLVFEHESVVRWRATLESALAVGPSSAMLAASLAVVDRAGSAPELVLAARCATLDESRACRAAFQQCVTHVLLRDESAYIALDGVMRTLSGDLACTVVRAVADTRKVAGAELLARWISSRRDLRLDVVPRLGSMARELEKPLPENVLAPVRELLEDGDADTLHECLIAAARLEDYAAIPSCIRWLREGTSGVRSDALWALQSISRLRLREDPIPWSQWFELESQWWEKESAEAFRALASGTKAEKIHTLSTISRMHAWRDKLAIELAVALEDRDQEVASQTAAILGTLGARCAVPALVRALEREESSVSHAAWVALKSITKKNLPADPRAWGADEVALR